MKLIIALFCIASIAYAGETKWGVAEDEHVAVLTNSNFSDFISKHPYVLVKFYAPWCGHCKSMAPAYSSLAKRMKEQNVPIAKVDATVEGDLATQFGIEGFPTLKMFIHGEPVDYQGERTEDAMYTYVMKKTGPASEEVKDGDDLKALSEMEISVVMFMPRDDEDTLKVFNTVAGKFEDLTFKYSFDESLKSEYENSPYVLVLFRNFDDGKKILVSDEKPSVEKLRDFITSVRFPLVSDFDEKAAERIFGSESSAMFFFTDNDSHPGLAEFKSFAKDNANRIIFSRSKISEDLGARLSEFLGITAADDATVRLIRFKNNNVDKFKVDNLTQEGYANALNEFEAGTLKAYYKSEPVPETNDESVKVVVGNNFDELVLNNDKFVMLEAYAPWCGHCKQLEPIYKQLGDLVKNDPDVVIAKIDATANEHSAIAIEGFPTIFLFKPGMKDTPLQYDGERNLESLVSFIEEHVGRKLADQVPNTEEL